MTEKLYKVTYYEWHFDRYGDRDYSYMEQWVTGSVLADLKADKHVDELEVHEVKE